MIAFNDTFSFHWDGKCWHLVHRYPNKGHNGKPPKQPFATETTFYGNLQQVADAIVRKSEGAVSEDCADMRQLLSAIDLLAKSVSSYVTKPNQPHQKHES